jgi:hypothetical protein
VWTDSLQTTRCGCGSHTPSRPWPELLPETLGWLEPFDVAPRRVHNPTMHPRRLSIPDARGHGATLRVTKHPEQRKIVLSHWRDGVCVASTPVELREVPALIGALADGLGDAIDTPMESIVPSSKQSLLSVIRGWLRPRLAQITELRLVRDPSKDEQVS